LYDITNQTSLDHLPEWTQLIRENAGDIPIVSIGDKFNLEKAREVSEGEISKIVEKYNLDGFAEISTKTGENVKETFEYLVENLLGKFT
jgi:GTPase SAR1 family protein